MALERIKTFSIEEVEAMVKEDVKNNSCRHCDKNNNHSIIVEGYDVYTTSLRYKTFIEKGYKCVCCGRTGAYYVLEKSHGSNLKRAHFNLYSEDDVLMTKDHILPKKMGGADCIENMQTMCAICNSEKGCTVPDGYEPSEVQKKKKSNREYFWCGKKKFSSLEKAAMGVAGGNKKRAAKAKAKIRDSVKNGTLYCGEVWRYGKEI
jgi:5-methylcytosine-specific restriction endonuclease McrA